MKIDKKSYDVVKDVIPGKGVKRKKVHVPRTVFLVKGKRKQQRHIRRYRSHMRLVNPNIRFKRKIKIKITPSMKKMSRKDFLSKDFDGDGKPNILDKKPFDKRRR